MSRPLTLSVAGAAVTLCGSALGQTAVVTGPSSSDTPYVVATDGSPVARIISILTVGDEVDGYSMLGIPDGMGGFRIDGNRMVVTINHEFTATASGVQHSHQPDGFSGGAFLSLWELDLTPGENYLGVLEGRDAMTSVATVSNGTGGSLFNFNRFCSGDVPEVSALFNAASGKGSEHRFHFTGEEAGCGGRLIATDLDSGVGYQVTAFDDTFGAWEQGVARPLESDQTVILATSDGCDNQVFLYIGEKTDTGNEAEKAGLLNGVAYGIYAQVDGQDVMDETREFGLGSDSLVLSAPFVLAPAGSPEGTSFRRPEDIGWDPANPTDAYFVTTDRFDDETQVGRSRLWRLRFDDAENLLAGGTIEALLDGTEAMQMGDNLVVFNDIQGGTRVLIQEDPGGNPYGALTQLYTVADDSLVPVLVSDPARFGNDKTPPTAPFNANEESSGVFDARDSMGLGWFVGNMQAHYSIADPFVQGGQLYAFYCPGCVGSCRADLAQPLDGEVGMDDLVTLLASWELDDVNDINADGVVNFSDLTELLASWGPCN